MEHQSGPEREEYERAVGGSEPFQQHIIGSGPVAGMLPYNPAEIDAVFRPWCDNAAGRTNRFRQRIYRKRR